MAIYTTFFLCRPDGLLNYFPGWKVPLANPTRREIRNPFTGQTMVVETREPEWTTDEGAPRRFVVQQVKGSYEDYLEGRLPESVRTAPHWAAKGLTDIEWEPLLGALGVGTELETPIYAPPSSGASLHTLPKDFISKIAESDLEATALKWAAAMSMPEYTQSVSGRKINDGWTTKQALDLLRPILSLVHRAAAECRMYLLIEA